MGWLISDVCRDALHQLQVPDLMREDLLTAMFTQQMTVPTHRDSWERFRQDFAGAVAQLFTPAVIQSIDSSPLELPVSLLISDIAKREYDFFLSVNSEGASSSLYSCELATLYVASVASFATLWANTQVII